MVALRNRFNRRSNRSSLTSSGSGEAGTIAALSETGARQPHPSLRLAGLTGGFRSRRTSVNSSAVGSAASGTAPTLGSSTTSSLTAMFRTSSGLRKKRHGSMLRNSSMSSVSLDDLASFSDTPPSIRTTSNHTNQLTTGSATHHTPGFVASARPVSIGSQFSEPPESSSLSRRARAAKSAVLSLTIEHSRLMAMLASVESMVHSASSNSSARTSAQFSSPQPNFSDPLPQSVQPSEPTRVQQLAAMYESQDRHACGRP